MFNLSACLRGGELVNNVQSCLTHGVSHASTDAALVERGEKYQSCSAKPRAHTRDDERTRAEGKTCLFQSAETDLPLPIDPSPDDSTPIHGSPSQHDGKVRQQPTKRSHSAVIIPDSNNGFGVKGVLKNNST